MLGLGEVQETGSDANNKGASLKVKGKLYLYYNSWHTAVCNFIWVWLWLQMQPLCIFIEMYVEIKTIYLEIFLSWY